MRKPQPFFLQVSPPKSLYWPFTVPEHWVWWHQGTEHPPQHCCPTTATPILMPYTLQPLPPLLLPLSNLKMGLLFPLISQVTHSNWNFVSATAEWRRSALLQSWHPALHQSTIWRSKPKKNCIFPKELLFKTIHMTSTPPVSTHTLGLNIQLLQWLVPAGVRTLGNTKRLVLKRLCLETGSRNHRLRDYLNGSHTRQVSLFPLISPMEFQGNRLWPLD